jgi:group I intron endonuclease
MNYTNTSGIYKIVNSITRDFYIGSAVSLTSRKAVHFKTLKNGTHGNYKLQNHYNLYGVKVFIFEVLEVVEQVSNLITREQYYIDTLKPTYNILRVAGSSLGYKYRRSVRCKISSTFKIKRDRISNLIIQMYNKGVAEREIAISLKTSVWRVHRILKENNIQIKNRSEYHKIKVYQYDTCLRLLREWDSCKEASEILNIDLSAISKCARGKLNSYKGFIWKYERI